MTATIHALGIPLAADEPGCTTCVMPAGAPGGKASGVTLLSGAQVCTWCPAWKAECAAIEPEARRVLGLLNTEARRAELSRIEAKRGEPYRARLEAGIMALWAARRPKSTLTEAAE